MTSKTSQPKRKRASADDIQGAAEQPSDEHTTKKTRTRKPLKGKQVRGKTGRLAHIMNMPIDVFMEIIQHLLPFDLLRLARTNKFIRSILTAKSSKGMWRIAISNIPNLPACPEDICEIAYTSLIFENLCSAPGCQRRVMKANFRHMTRLCSVHQPDMQISNLQPDELKPWGNKVIEQLYRLVPCSSYLPTKAGVRELEELLRSKVGDPSDTAALDAFIEERIAYMQKRNQVAGKLETWVANQKDSKSIDRVIKTEKRKRSIESKLSALGWKYDDYKDGPRAIDAEDYHGMFHQPTLLTDTIWKRIRPKLEVILEKRKTARLAKERLARVAQRRTELAKLLPMLWPNAKILEASKVPEGATAWSLSTPSSEAHFRRLPSLERLVENDTVEITLPLLESKLDDIIPDILLFQMQRRQALVELLSDAEKNEKPTRYGVDWDWTWRTENREELERNDEANLEILSRPTSLFRLSRPSGRYLRSAYPPKVDETPVLPYQTAFEGTRMLRMTAERLLDAIGSDKPTMETLIDKGVMFRCGHCDGSGDSWFEWEELVEHYAQEQQWYEKQKMRREREKITSPAWINTHDMPSVIHDDEEHTEHNEGTVDESGKRYKCKYCGDSPLAASFRLVRFCGKQGISGMPAGIAVLHLKYRHDLVVPEEHSELLKHFWDKTSSNSSAYGGHNLLPLSYHWQYESDSFDDEMEYEMHNMYGGFDGIDWTSEDEEFEGEGGYYGPYDSDDYGGDMYPW